MNDLGKLLFIIGLVLVILGAVMWKPAGWAGSGGCRGTSFDCGLRIADCGKTARENLFPPSAIRRFSFPVVLSFLA